MDDQLKGQMSIYDYLRPKEVIVKGLMDDGYCPNCNACLDDLIKECPYCGCELLWNDWKRLNMPDFETMTISEAAEIIGNELNITFTPSPKMEGWNREEYRAKHKGFSIDLYFNHFAEGVYDGARFLSVGVQKGPAGCGVPARSIEEAVRNIKAYIEKEEKRG